MGYLCVCFSWNTISAFWLRSIKKVLNIIGIIFLFVFLGMERMRLQIHRPTRWPQPDQSEWLLVRFVGGTWKHGSHITYTVPTLQFVIFSAGYLFRLYFGLAIMSCGHFLISFMGKFYFYFNVNSQVFLQQNWVNGKDLALRLLLLFEDIIIEVWCPLNFILLLNDFNMTLVCIMCTLCTQTQVWGLRLLMWHALKDRIQFYKLGWKSFIWKKGKRFVHSLLNTWLEENAIQATWRFEPT